MKLDRFARMVKQRERLTGAVCLSAASMAGYQLACQEIMKDLAAYKKRYAMKCKATLLIGDDYGDNSCTMHCQLNKRHGGPHFETYTSDSLQKVVVTWTKEKVKP